MNKALARQIGEETQAALAAVAAKHGLVVTVAGGKFDPNLGTFSPKIEYAAPGSAQKEWDRYCKLIGLEPEDFGTTVVLSGKAFTLTGITLRRRAYPVDAECGGKSFKLSTDHVLAGKARAAAAR